MNYHKKLIEDAIHKYNKEIGIPLKNPFELKESYSSGFTNTFRIEIKTLDGHGFVSKTETEPDYYGIPINPDLGFQMAYEEAISNILEKGLTWVREYPICEKEALIKSVNSNEKER